MTALIWLTVAVAVGAIIFAVITRWIIRDWKEERSGEKPNFANSVLGPIIHQDALASAVFYGLLVIAISNLVGEFVSRII